MQGNGKSLDARYDTRPTAFAAHGKPVLEIGTVLHAVVYDAMHALREGTVLRIQDSVAIIFYDCAPKVNRSIPNFTAALYDVAPFPSFTLCKPVALCL
jgi:hypothetical protein